AYWENSPASIPFWYLTGIIYSLIVRRLAVHVKAMPQTTRLNHAIQMHNAVSMHFFSQNSLKKRVDIA
ncbi:MAG: hypothetical protein ACRCV9_16190, partial [Burkholderiaceae bacterium]